MAHIPASCVKWTLTPAARSLLLGNMNSHSWAQNAGPREKALSEEQSAAAPSWPSHTHIQYKPIYAQHHSEIFIFSLCLQRSTSVRLSVPGAKQSTAITVGERRWEGGGKWGYAILKTVPGLRRVFFIMESSTHEFLESGNFSSASGDDITS